MVGQTLEEVRDAHAIWGSGAAVRAELAPSGESGERVRRTDRLTRTLTGRRSLSERRESVGDYIYAGTRRREKKEKVWGEEASLKLRTVSSCIYVLYIVECWNVHNIISYSKVVYSDYCRVRKSTKRPAKDLRGDS